MRETNLVSIMQLYFANLKADYILSFVQQLIKMSQFRPLSGNNMDVLDSKYRPKSLILNGNFRDFFKRGPGICHLQNGNSRRPCFRGSMSSKLYRLQRNQQTSTDSTACWTAIIHSRFCKTGYA